MGSDGRPGGPGNNRVEWIDIGKGLCIILVVFLHSTSYYKTTGGAVPDLIAKLVNGLAPIRMPSLIFLSGLMMHFGLRKGVKTFLTRRIHILVWPYLIWSVLWAFASDNVDKMSGYEWWMGNWHLWFLFFIILYSAVAAILPVKYHAYAAFYAYLLSLWMEDGTKYGERLFFFMSLFLTGSALGRNIPRLEAMVSDRKTIILAPAGLAVLLYSAFYGPVRYSPHDYGMIAIIVFLTLAFCHWLSLKSELPHIAAMGRNSITIYLVHMPVIAIIIRLFRGMGMDSFYPIFITSFLVSMAASLLMIWLRKRVAVADILFQFPKQFMSKRRDAITSVA